MRTLSGRLGRFEAIKAAGLDELTELDAKLRLLQQEGATEDLLDRVRRVGSRHVTQEHAKTMGKTGTRFTEDLIDHVMWGRGQSNQEFARLGAKGVTSPTISSEWGIRTANMSSSSYGRRR